MVFNYHSIAAWLPRHSIISPRAMFFCIAYLLWPLRENKSLAISSPKGIAFKCHSRIRVPLLFSGQCYPCWACATIQLLPLPSGFHLLFHRLGFQGHTRINVLYTWISFYLLPYPNPCCCCFFIYPNFSTLFWEFWQIYNNFNYVSESFQWLLLMNIYMYIIIFTRDYYLKSFMVSYQVKEYVILYI